MPPSSVTKHISSPAEQSRNCFSDLTIGKCSGAAPPHFPMGSYRKSSAPADTTIAGWGSAVPAGRLPKIFFACGSYGQVGLLCVGPPACEFWIPVSCPTLVTTRRRCSVNLAINLGVFHPRRSSSSTTISQTAPSCTLARGSSQAPNCGAPARERPATQRQVGLPHQLPQQPESILQVDSKRCAQVQSS